VSHANNPAIFVKTANTFEVWIYDDSFPEIFVLPANLATPTFGGTVGNWKRWPSPPPPTSTWGSASMVLADTRIFLFGGNNNVNSR
jgi:hypothetical protein